jgi:uncharacterized tellurite resistance protein B-like protein
MSDVEAMRVVENLADLLMGAAYADNNLDGREKATVRTKLADLLEVAEIPDELSDRIEGFDPKTFDLETSAALLATEGAELAREVLELVAAVNDADEELDLDEDKYLRDLAKALGVAESEYSDLKLEIVSVEDLREDLRRLTALPPPIPSDS